MTLSPPQSVERPVFTVQGPLQYECLGITDAHNHMWIEPVPGADPSAPILNQFNLILEELVEYREKGGETLLDCQPEGCGRDGNQLLALSMASKVNLIACTGFHRKKYYPQNHWLWGTGAQKICDFLYSELEQGLVETLETPSPVRASFIKIALESTWTDPMPPWRVPPLLRSNQKRSWRSTQKKAPWRRKLAYISQTLGCYPISWCYVIWTKDPMPVSTKSLHVWEYCLNMTLFTGQSTTHLRTFGR
jgi:hypothetical protein